MDFVKNSGNEKAWLEKKEQFKKQENRKFFEPMVARPSKLKEETKSEKKSTVSVTPVIPISDLKSFRETQIKRNDEPIISVMQKDLTQNEPNDLEGKKKMMKNTDLENKNTNFNGIRGIEKLTESEQNKTAENEILGVELKQSLTLVREVTSSQVSLLDSSAELLFERMKQLSNSKMGDGGDVVLNPSHMNIELSIGIAKTINELMRTKREALKTTADIIKMMRER